MLTRRQVETQAMQQLLADTGNIHTYEQVSPLSA